MRTRRGKLSIGADEVRVRAECGREAFLDIAVLPRRTRDKQMARIRARDLKETPPGKREKSSLLTFSVGMVPP